MRQAPHLCDERKVLFFSKFQLDLEAGLGDAVGRLSDAGVQESNSLDPPIMLQWSDDGGHTWSNEEWVTAGRLGQYKHRAIWRRLGRSRTRTWRVVMSEPVPWRLLDAYVDVEKGIS